MCVEDNRVTNNSVVYNMKKALSSITAMEHAQPRTGYKRRLDRNIKMITENSKHILMIAAAFTCIMVVMATQYHPPSRRMITGLWGGGVAFGGGVVWEVHEDATRAATDDMHVNNGGAAGTSTVAARGASDTQDTGTTTIKETNPVHSDTITETNLQNTENLKETTVMNAGNSELKRNVLFLGFDDVGLNLRLVPRVGDEDGAFAES